MSESSLMMNSIDSLMGELAKLREEVQKKVSQDERAISESEQVKALTNELARLQNENERLMEKIQTLNLQLKFFNDDEKGENLLPCHEVTRNENSVYVSGSNAEFIVPTGAPRLMRRMTNQMYFNKEQFVLKTCSMDSCSISAPGIHIKTTPSTLNVVRLCWEIGRLPRKVLIIKKKDNLEATETLIRMVKWLQEREISVIVEPAVFDELQLPGVTTWDEGDRYHLAEMMDFVITLGGDGTLLYASSLFFKSMPPVICYHMGTLGFLTPFSASSFEGPLSRLIAGDVPLTIRCRLEYRIIRKDNPQRVSRRGLSFDYFAGDMIRAEPNLKILNDIVIDRGTSSSMVELDCYIDSAFLTTVHADGLIIATPTGSTAYSMSAGGSMVHPLTPSILMTPICPHTLSFRQMLLPDSTVLRIQVSENSRCAAAVSFDGQFKDRLNKGDMLIIRTSKYPVPSVSPDDMNNDWFKSVRDSLHWNKATSSIVDKKENRSDEIVW